MNVFGAWMQDNWYQLGSFFVQFAFLCAVIWFARRILRTLRASQEQVGALLKLSFYGSAPERTFPEHTPEAAPLSHSAEPAPSFRAAEIPATVRPASETNSYWLPPTPSEPATSFVTSRENPLHTVSSGSSFTGWLKSPMKVTSGTSPFHRVLRWLQSPAHS